MTVVTSLGHALEWRIRELQAEYLNGAPSARAQLARLRRGVGKEAGSVPEIWDITIGAVPDRLSWDRDEPNRAEQAAHTALTLYAVHQQSRTREMHVKGRTFGSAVRLLSRADGVSDDAVTRRFMAVATAESTDEVLLHVRGLVTQLKSRDIGLDYARFADDVMNLLTPGRENRVRLAWGRDYYRTRDSADEKQEDTDETEEMNS